MDPDQWDEETYPQPPTRTGTDATHDASYLGRIQSGISAVDSPPNYLGREKGRGSESHTKKTEAQCSS